MDRSEIGRTLASFARGVKKTMSPAAIKQRKAAAKISAEKRRKRARETVHVV